MKVTGNFKGSSSRDNTLIVIDILDCSQSISSSFLDHGDGVLVGTLHQDCAALGVLHSFDESILVFSQDSLADTISPSLNKI